MNFPTSSIGLPQSLKYDLPPSFSDSARAYSVNVSPDGITQVTGPSISATNTTFVANAPVNFGAFNSQVVSFTIPSGMSQSVFLDPHSTTLSFTLTYNVTTATATNLTVSGNLINCTTNLLTSLYNKVSFVYDSLL